MNGVCELGRLRAGKEGTDKGKTEEEGERRNLRATANAVDDDSLALERDDAALVAVVEAQAEHHALGTELLGGAIEEHILLQMGDLVRGGQQRRNFLVSGGIGQADLHLHLHRK